jgi:hypothetical protein
VARSEWGPRLDAGATRLLRTRAASSASLGGSHPGNGCLAVFVCGGIWRASHDVGTVSRMSATGRGIEPERLHVRATGLHC